MFGRFAEDEPREQGEMLHVNIVALTGLTRRFLPRMIERGSGRIQNIASTAAFQPGPLMGVYYATKAYVLSFSLALSEEVRGTGVTVTALCPGVTETGFQGRAKMQDHGSSPGAGCKVLGRSPSTGTGMMAGRPLAVEGTRNRILAPRNPPRAEVPRRPSRDEGAGASPLTPSDRVLARPASCRCGIAFGHDPPESGASLSEREDLMVREFREFITKGNLVEIAVAFILGLAFASVVSAFTNVIMSLIGAIFGGDVSFDALTVDVNGTPIPYGAFLTALVNFVIVAFILFLIVKAYNRLRKQAESPTRPCDFCKTDVPKDAIRCPACTSELRAAA